MQLLGHCFQLCCLLLHLGCLLLQVLLVLLLPRLKHGLLGGLDL
jgi:hypothetical protein